MHDFDSWVVAQGFDPAALTEKQKLSLQAQWRKEQGTAGAHLIVDAAGNPVSSVPRAPAPEPKPAEKPGHGVYSETIAAIDAENARQEYILDRGMALMKSYVGDREKCQQIREMTDAAIADPTCDTRKFDLDIVRLDRYGGPAIIAGGTTPVTDTVVEAAVCMTAGLETLEKEYDPKTLEAARKNFKGGLGLQDLVGFYARKNGWRGGSLKAGLNSPSVLRAAFRGPDEMYAGVAGPSTYSLPTIFNNVANKFLRIGFEGVDQAWRKISAKRTVTDFKEITTASLTGGLMFRQLPPGGEIQHGTVGELTYTNQVNTQALMFGIDRRDLINDDLGALTSVSRRLGRGGALRLNDMFWTEFLANTAFFSAGNANVITGATSVLSGATGLEALRLADAVFAAQTDPDGFPVAIRAKFLLVPSGLRISALNLMNSTVVQGTTTANSLMGTANAFAGAYEVVDSPYLSNTSYSGSSATAWYLIADPMDMPVIEVAFLNGVETPTIETTDADFNTLGIALRGYFDPGVNLQEFRGGVRAAGA